MTTDLTTITRALSEHGLDILNDTCSNDVGEPCGWKAKPPTTSPDSATYRQHRAHLAAVLAAAHDTDTAAAESRGAERAWREVVAVLDKYRSWHHLTGPAASLGKELRGLASLAKELRDRADKVAGR